MILQVYGQKTSKAKNGLSMVFSEMDDCLINPAKERQIEDIFIRYYFFGPKFAPQAGA